jgi:hypothetical protein
MTNSLRTPLTLFSLSGFVLLNACRKSDTPSPSGGLVNGSTISSPIMLDLIPAQNQLEGDRRVYLPIAQVGSSKLALTTVFDTGSEGLLLSGSSIFNASYISDTGIVMSSPDSVVINGITVTSAKVSTTYGSPPATRTFYGNVCYASIVFGDQSGTVQSERMPFIVIYKGVDNQTNDSVALDANSNGIAGIQSSGFSAASENTLVTTRTGVKSPFNYFNYTNGLYAGFVLSPLSDIGWSNVASNQGYPASKLLTLGISESMKSGFSLQSQRFDIGNLYDPDILATVSYGTTTLPNTNLLFDTGTPVGYSIYNPSVGGSTTLASGISVQVASPEGFSYNYTTDDLLFQTTAQSNGQQRCIFGIDFFLNNSFMLDYTEHYIGLKGA